MIGFKIFNHMASNLDLFTRLESAWLEKNPQKAMEKGQIKKLGKFPSE